MEVFVLVANRLKPVRPSDQGLIAMLAIKTMILLFVVGLCCPQITRASAEQVEVKYRGAVDLKPFSCADLKAASSIECATIARIATC